MKKILLALFIIGFVTKSQCQELNVTINKQDILCYGQSNGTASANATGGTEPYEYNWSNSMTEQSISNLSQGNYSVTVEDAIGTTVTASILIESPPEFLYSISPSQGICIEQSVVISVSAYGGTMPYNYVWSDSPELNINTRTVSPVETTTYSVTVYDDNLCSYTPQHTTVEVSQINVTVSTSDVACFGECSGTALLNMSGGMPPYLFSWDSNTDYLENICAGEYEVTVSDMFECTGIAQYEINVLGGLTLDNIITGQATCFGNDDGFVQVFISGGTPPISYTWSNGQTQSFFMSYAGTYSVTVSDAVGCSLTEEIIIDEPDPIIAFPHSDTTICEGNSVIIQLDSIVGGDPPYITNWSNLGTGQSFITHPSESTTYTANVYDSRDCAGAPVDFVVNVNPLYESTDSFSICQGDSVFWQNSWYSIEGNYEATYESISGCDSLFELELLLLPLPLQFSHQQIPENGILSQDSFGQISLLESEVETVYYIVSGGQIVSEEIEGTGNAIDLGSNFSAGTYEIMSRKNNGGCELLQHAVVFVNESESNIITASVGYGNPSIGFHEGEVLVSLYKSGLDSDNNPIAYNIEEQVLGINGQAEFENLENGTYYLTSAITDPQYSAYYEHVFYQAGMVFENATEIDITETTNYIAQINHPLLVETQGTNQGSGIVGTNNESKALVPKEGLVVVLKDEDLSEIIDISITDNSGNYSFESIPDNTNVKIFVTSLEHQLWQAYSVLTSSEQEYNVNFLVDGNSVSPTDLQGISINNISNFNFSVYPNPANEIIYFENIPNNTKFSLFDIKGNLIKSGNMKNNVLSVNEYTSGAYIIILTTKSGKTGLQKFTIR